MFPTAHPLAEGIARLEVLIGRLEAGEPLESQVLLTLERLTALCAMPLPEDLEPVRALLEGLQQEPSSRGLPRLREALDRALAEAPSGPTASPRANALLDLAVATVAGHVGPEWTGDFVAFDEELASLAVRIGALARAGATGRTLEEAEGVVREAEAARSALAVLADAVAAGSEEAVRTAGQGLVGAINLLARRQRTLGRLAEQEGRTPCVRCGRYNSSERSTCEECGAILPVAARTDESRLDIRVGDEDAPTTRMTANLARIFEACEQFYAGALGPEAFLQEVAWLEGLLGRARRMGLGEGDLARLGQDDFETGLALLRQAGETGDGALLDMGRRMIWEGAGKLQASA